MSEFVLINGHGIFPRDSILEVVPNVAEEFFVNAEPPALSVDNFVFNLVKRVQIDIEVLRLLPVALKSKKEEPTERLVDDNYSRILEEQYELNEKEFLSTVYGDSEPSKVILDEIKSYKRRLAGIEQYKQKIQVIQANPDAPDFQSSLLALSAEAPTPEILKKQEKSLERITRYAQKDVNSILSKNDEAHANAEDTEEVLDHALINLFESDNHRDDIAKRTSQLLKTFYKKNFDVFDSVLSDEEDEEDEEADSQEVGAFFDNQVDEALNKADLIKNADDTLRNTVDDDDASPASAPSP